MATEQPAMSVAVIDTSPLVVLAKVGRLDLVLEGLGRLVVPTAVASEINAGPMDDPARLALNAGRLGAPVPSEALARVLEWGLGAGESAVLSLAQTQGGLAILDDREARRAAQALGVPVVGTLGIVLHAARRGRVESPKVLVQALRDAGLRLDEKAIAHAFETILGEGAPDRPPLDGKP
jgi:predicted nucleic acid-binding protein